MHYIETTSMLEMEEVQHNAPRNWIPERKWTKYKSHSKISLQNTKVLEVHPVRAKSGEILPRGLSKLMESNMNNIKSKILHNKPQESELHSTPKDGEDFEKDFLISPGDVYPNRKVRIQDAEITNETRKQFEEMCNKHP